MKIIISIYIIFFALCIYCKAESDTLVVKLKNSQEEKIALSQIQKIKFENITGVEEQNYQSLGLELSGNNPNPFIEETNIKFEIVSSGEVVVTIYDNNGNQIQRLECSDCQQGKNTITWNCLDNNNNRVHDGIYYYQVRFNNQVQSKKMLLVR